MKKLFFLLSILFNIPLAQAQEFQVQEIPYNTIDKVYICYQEDNFVFLQHQPDGVLGRNYRHIPLRFDRAFITQSNLPAHDPIKITYPQQGVPYYSYQFRPGQNGQLYVAIRSRAQLTPVCTGRDERSNTVFTITNIPEGADLFITYKQIEAMEIPGADQVEGGVGLGPVPQRELEPARNNGINIPDVPAHGIFIPQAQNPEAAPAPAEEVSVNSDNPAENPNENPVMNAPKIEIPSRRFNPQTEVGKQSNESDLSTAVQLKDNSSGCSLQKNAPATSGMGIMLITFLAGILSIRSKTKHS